MILIVFNSLCQYFSDNSSLSVEFSLNLRYYTEIDLYYISFPPAFKHIALQDKRVLIRGFYGGEFFLFYEFIDILS